MSIFPSTTTNTNTNTNTPQEPPHEELQYLHLIRHILQYGTRDETRNGTTLSVFGKTMEFNLQNGTIPLLTTKQLAWKTCFRELIWFIRGSTNNTLLQDKKVKIWNDNASREFLDSRGLTHLEENDLGPIYGHQWRFFNADYKDCHTDYTGQGIDQLQNIITMLKDPTQHTSRRMVMTAWNPCQIDQMALPPCHVLIQFKVRESKYLSCLLYQRSGDVGLGVPFNIASYSFLCHILAHYCGLIPDKFIHVLGDAHIYENHVVPLSQQVQRTPIEFPRIQFPKGKIPEHIEDYDETMIEWITPYTHQGTISMQMSA